MESHKWLHLYAFFNCLLKLSAQKDAKSHWLHLYAFFKRLLGLVRCVPHRRNLLEQELEGVVGVGEILHCLEEKEKTKS